MTDELRPLSQDAAPLYEQLQSLSDPVSFLTSIFTYAPIGFAIWKPDGHCLLTNQAFFDLFGSTPPSGYNILEDEIAAEAGLLSLIQRAFTGEVVHVPTFWYDARDLKQVEVKEGQRVAITMNVFPIRDRQGAIEFVAATYKDETEATLTQEHLRQLSEELAQRAAELEQKVQERTEALDRQRLFLREVIDASPSMIFVKDFDANFVLANQLVARMYNTTVEGLIGKSDIDFNPDNKEIEDFLEADRRVIASGQPLFLEEPVTNLAGETHSFQTTKVPISDVDGTSKYVLGVSTDITRRRQAEDHIKQLLKDLQQRAIELEATNLELESFSYSVSHDLRAPLRSIDGFSQILIEDYGDQLDAAAHGHLKRVRAASQHMGQLIDDLIKLSHVTRSEMSRAQVDLSAIARKIADDLRAAKPEREAEFVIAPGLTADADSSLMRILMSNLLDNAWKYSGKKPRARIEFGLTQRDGKDWFFVRDDGAGFDMAFAEKLFGAFQRLHSPKEFEGTGIGLATVQRIVRRHGGQIWAEAAVGEGATFYFSL